MNTHVLSVHERNKPYKCDISHFSGSQKSSMNTHVESIYEGKKSTCDFHGKMSDVRKSKHDTTVQKQGHSNAMEENDILSNLIEQNLDEEITIKEEWDVFDQEQESY